MLVGRDRELGAVEELLDRTAAGPAVLALVGPPGVGKSALLDETARRAAIGGMCVLRAGPSPSETQLAFGGLADLLRGVDDAVLAGLPGTQRGALLAALARGDGRRPAAGLAVLAAFAAALQRLAASGAVAIVVDDLQWLDGPSAEALAYAARRAG